MKEEHSCEKKKLRLFETIKAVRRCGNNGNINVFYNFFLLRRRSVKIIHCQWLDFLSSSQGPLSDCQKCSVVEFISHDFPYVKMWEVMLGLSNGSDTICCSNYERDKDGIYYFISME